MLARNGGGSVAVTDAKSLAVDPGWSSETIGRGKLQSVLHGDALAQAGQWTASVRTTIQWQQTTAGSIGTNLGPTRFTLVRVDALTGAVLYRSRVPEDSALLGALASLREDVWLSGGEVVGLATWPTLLVGEAQGIWSFGVARPMPAASASDEPRPFVFETLTGAGPRVDSTVR